MKECVWDLVIRDSCIEMCVCGATKTDYNLFFSAGLYCFLFPRGIGFAFSFLTKYKCVRNFSPSLGNHFNMSGSKSEEIGSLIYFCNDFKNLVTVQHPRKSTIVVLISC